MPIWLRKFTYKSIEKFYKEQNEANEKASKQIKGKRSKIASPNIRPTYTSKASK